MFWTGRAVTSLLKSTENGLYAILALSATFIFYQPQHPRKCKLYHDIYTPRERRIIGHGLLRRTIQIARYIPVVHPDSTRKTMWWNRKGFFERRFLSHTSKKNKNPLTAFKESLQWKASKTKSGWLHFKLGKKGFLVGEVGFALAGGQWNKRNTVVFSSGIDFATPFF